MERAKQNPRDVKPWREPGHILALGRLEFSFDAGGSQEWNNETKASGQPTLL